MLIESITYNIDGDRITVTHEREGVIFAEYSHNMKSASYKVTDTQSAYLAAVAILGAYFPDVPNKQVQDLTVTLRELASSHDH